MARTLLRRAEDADRKELTIGEEGRQNSEAEAGDGAGRRDLAFTVGQDGPVCCECGTVQPNDQVIPYGKLWVCAACKPAFFQKLKEGVRREAKLEYAGFWIRFAAKLIDGVVLFMFELMLLTPGAANPADGDQGYLSVLLVTVGFFFARLVCGALYTILLVGKYGATLGKMVCGLKVVSEDGDRISYARASDRFVAEFLSFVTLAIGYIVVAFDGQKRALHDHMCSTRVIRCRPDGTATPVRGEYHGLLFLVLLVDAVLCLAGISHQSAGAILLASAVTLTAILLVIAAIVAQRSSDLPRSLKRLTWVVFFQIHSLLVAGLVIGVVIAARSPGSNAPLLPVDHPPLFWLFVSNAGTDLLLALLGVVSISRYWRSRGGDAQGTL